MDSPDDDRAPFAKGLALAHSVTSTSIMMVLPAAVGYFADQYLGTVVLFTFLGLVLGMGGAFWQLLKLVGSADGGDKSSESAEMPDERTEVKEPKEES